MNEVGREKLGKGRVMKGKTQAYVDSSAKSQLSSCLYHLWCVNPCIFSASDLPNDEVSLQNTWLWVSLFSIV